MIIYCRHYKARLALNPYTYRTNFMICSAFHYYRDLTIRTYRYIGSPDIITMLLHSYPVLLLHWILTQAIVECRIRVPFYCLRFGSSSASVTSAARTRSKKSLQSSSHNSVLLVLVSPPFVILRQRFRNRHMTLWQSQPFFHVCVWYIWAWPGCSIVGSCRHYISPWFHPSHKFDCRIVTVTGMAPVSLSLPTKSWAPFLTTIYTRPQNQSQLTNQRTQYIQFTFNTINQIKSQLTNQYNKSN